MARLCWALALLVLTGMPAAGADPPLTPQAGLLVLRNGQVLEGQITQAGDYYVVTLGATGEVRLPTTDVEMQCASLDEAYELKRDAVFPRGVTAHLALAEWCLRHRLTGKCAEQLVAAMRLDPEDPRIVQLERRLVLASQSPPEAKEKLPAGAATVSAEELEKVLGDLPAGSVERFSIVIQPILLNRCGASQCHGPNAKSDFRLLKPPVGQAAVQRFTQRNLYGVLQHLDSAKPAASPLLVLPQRRHGSALAAVFDKQTQKQLDELTAWVKLTLAAPRAAAPASIPAADGTLSQAAPLENVQPVEPPAAAGNSASGGNSAPAVRVMRPPLADATAASKPAPAAGGFVPRDEFDPEIFNRKYTQRR